MTDLASDRALLDAFRRGEPTAMAEVYRQHSRALFTFLRHGFAFNSQGTRHRFRGFADPIELESAVQEVFTRAFSPGSRQAYDGLRPYRNYLFAIARNLTIDRFRRGRREQCEPLEPDQEDEVSQNTPELDAEQQELAGHVREFVAALPPELQGIFEVRFHDGLSVELAAKKLGVSEHKVRREEKRLRKSFFLAMRRHGYFEGFRYNAAGIQRMVGLMLAFHGVAQ